MAAASALLAVALAGPPLYVSSATSKALQTSVATTCPSDSGVLLDVPASAVADLDERAAAIANVRPPVHTELVGIRLRGTDSSSPAQLLWRDGLASAAAGSIAEPPAGQVAVPGSYAAERSLRTGDTLTATAAADTGQLSFDVAGFYPDVALQPEPAYWCALRQLLRPDGSGDAPAPVLLAARSTVRSAAGGAPTTLWELHPDGDHLTRSAARDLLDDYRALVASAGDAGEGTGAVTPVADQTEPGLGRLIDDADDAGDTVARRLGGIRLAAVVMSLALLIVAAAGIVRARRDEMRLRVIRGERAGGIAVRIAEAHAVAALAGTVVGAVGAYAAVRALGPSPDLDPGAVRTAVILVAGGLVGAIAVVACAGAVVADRLVDRPPKLRRRRFAPPWELVPLALAVAAAARLDRTTGVRIVGTGAPGGDALADAFPGLTLVAAGSVIVRPLRWLLRRARHGGRRLGPSMLLAWRRLGADPARHAFLAGAVAVGLGATIVAASFTSATDRMVTDKATTFLGADLRVVTAGEPIIPDNLRATPISRLTTRVDGSDVQLVGIDPDTFADVVRWRDDASDYPLAELLDVLAADDMEGAPLPAVVVGGPVPARVLDAGGGVEIDINPVATAAFFPGKTSTPLVIVNRDALAADGVDTAAEIWLHEPPADATRELAAAGNLVRGSQGPSDVFVTSSVQAVRWADQALWAFAVFVAVVALVVALLVVGSRRDERRAARTLLRTMGEPDHQELTAAAIALAIPALIGAVAGVAAGLLTVRIVGDHLDTVGNLPPNAEHVYDLAPAAAAGAVALAVVVVAAVAARVAVLRRQPKEVLGHVRGI